MTRTWEWIEAGENCLAYGYYDSKKEFKEWGSVKKTDEGRWDYLVRGKRMGQASSKNAAGKAVKQMHFMESVFIAAADDQMEKYQRKMD